MKHFIFELMLAFLIICIVLPITAYIILSSEVPAYSQYTHAYYECDNDDRQYVRFEAPDTMNKRVIATRFYSCYPLPQVVTSIPDGGIVIGFIKNSDEHPIFQYQRGR